MRQLISSLILIIFIGGCNSENDRLKEERLAKDFVVKQYMKTNMQLDSTLRELYKEKDLNKDLIIKCEHLKEENNSYMQQSLNYNNAIIGTYYLTDKNKKIEAEKNSLITETKAYQKKYEQSIRDNERIKFELEAEKQNKEAIKNERDNLQASIKQAADLKITGLSIMGIGTYLFREIRTYKASRIKKVRVKFSLPENSIATKENKNISIFIYSRDKRDSVRHDTTVYYHGAECLISLDLKQKEFKAGKHLVNIKINNKLQPPNEFEVIN